MAKSSAIIVDKKRELKFVKPLLKWAGGKTQLLGDILPKIPAAYGKYIEPFFGGGALFFTLQPKESIITDSNPELINMYKQVAYNVEDVIALLQDYTNTDEMFYSVRKQEWTLLSPVEAAARMIFLNKTCYNGLYRVNKSGNFNVPFGKYKNPNICDKVTLRAASEVLRRATILCSNYTFVLDSHAQPDDFIFLDPPYMPVSEYADFKRYTKEQFYEEDHVELARVVTRLHEKGCHIVLTNSNHPLVHELYGNFNIDVVKSKRHISCNGDSRKSKDVIVAIPPKKRMLLNLLQRAIPAQVEAYPPTRFMGSKSKLLSQIWSVASQFTFDTAIDLFAGSGIVSYMFKTHKKSVISNDYLAMSNAFTKALIENSTVTLSIDEAQKLLVPAIESDHFVQTVFKGIYYTDTENALIDTLRSNIAAMKDEYQRAIAMSALIRACIKKRPRGIFTYTGERYNDGRMDLKKSLETQFLEAVAAINKAVFDNGRPCKSKHGDAMQLRVEQTGLVYIDPPYYSPLSDNEYVRRYHFVEGLARDWKGVEIQQHTKTRKFKSYPTPFSTRNGAADAFDLLFKKHRRSVIIVSYSSNSLPTLDEMVSILSKYKQHVEVIPVDYRYSFGNQGDKVGNNMNKVQEYLFAGY